MWNVSFPPLLIRHQVCWKVCHSYMVTFLANDKLQVPISTNEIDRCWKRLLWRFPSLINILTQSSVSHCVVGIQTLAWKKWNYSHCVPGISFHVQMNMLFYEYERKKKKVSPQSIPLFMYSGDVWGQGIVGERHLLVWKRHYLTQQMWRGVLWGE